MSKLAASILAGDVLHLGDAGRLVTDTGCDYLHFDIMDGVFVPNLSFGPHVLAGLKTAVRAVYDTHLMVCDPMTLIDAFAKAGSHRLTVHVEAKNFEESLAKIRKLGLGVGASLKPATPASSLVPYFDKLDLILVMSVEPGFGGQKLIPSQVDKIRELRALGFQGEIEVDGGVTLENGPLLVHAGADTLVMGTSFFAADDPQAVADAVHGF
ncbi:MAG: ribulose-phosphate 3-epimerase [Clostridiales bacterium]|nr:ribulose-phosphate 3-epimerase [Clostridiales bacterium]